MIEIYIREIRGIRLVISRDMYSYRWYNLDSYRDGSRAIKLPLKIGVNYTELRDVYLMLLF